MDCCNFKLEGEKFHYVSENYEEFKNEKDKGKIIHWLPAKNNVKVEVLMNDGRIISGLGEDTIKGVDKEKIVQFERRFFAKFNQTKNDKIKFCYLHK